MKLSPKLLTSVGIAILGVSTFNLVMKSNIEDKKNKEIAKEYVKKNAPDKYMNLLEKESKGQTIRWNNAVENVRDSLRIDSMCKKAYFDGAQMVRDSIKQANINTNAIIKTIK